ncbi:hypothetical protein A5767_03210 [Rhodococcus sp. 852002-51564_SCH6189132-a]|uniref:prolyl oligopeptidase family serine peptidase n=1 Tax=Rhodococcus sp. 852002-51564_SCH6189132-a TaxID=1834103 RepID=UPI0007EBC61A|nr:prolyl oligopeptidase family serine peptidase [Rhodococcus sp. 852002-51564_SCH6189132-a]OBA39587.1 hypothetical protein A5767_03210 [Rhodococcus sp. 852002-51564_SCH6189132-a]
MTSSSFPINDALDAALARWEQYGRPGTPDTGFVLSRLPGRRTRGIYVAGSEQPIFEPDAHILAMSPAPDGRRIALQLAERADEDGVLAVLDTTSGNLRHYNDIHCRYEPMQWTPDARSLAVVARSPQRLVQVDVVHDEVTVEPVAGDARCRLFSAGIHMLLAESRPASPTRLIRLDNSARLGSFPSITGVFGINDGDVLVYGGNALHVLDAHSGVERWRWMDPAVRLTAVTVTGDTVHASAVRAGASVLLRLAHGTVIDEWPVNSGGSVASITDLGADGGRTYVVIEAPAVPPHVVTVDERTRGGGAATVAGDFETVRHEFAADDGETLTVVVTSPKGLTGPAPTILTCYGGFGVPDLPVFEPTIPAWVESRGRYATAHIRGGGEHGEQWRRAGYGAGKRRGIDDLADAARGLAGADLTNPELLVLAGASHGGTVVASCALDHRGICTGFATTAAPLDLLSLEKHPLGRIWLDEFGDTSSPEGTQELRAISPLHRAKMIDPEHRLPRFLGIVLAEDSRVNPDDSYALASVLREAGAEALVWEAPHAGHGSNHLDSLHSMGSVLLSFAAHTTRRTRSSEGRHA